MGNQGANGMVEDVSSEAILSTTLVSALHLTQSIITSSTIPPLLSFTSTP